MVYALEPDFFVQKEGMALPYDLVCFSHLRWDFVYQRPQHLLSRCAQERRVFFIEEPVFEGEEACLTITRRGPRLWTIVPSLPLDCAGEEGYALQRRLLDELFVHYGIEEYVCWYYSPMALGFTRHLTPLAIVYDCMDELSAFKNAPTMMCQYEAELLQRAHLVFTGGHSLYEAKRHKHPHVYAFPSSVDTEHFIQARKEMEDPSDQAPIPHPRLGFYGVIDERMDLELLSTIAEARPDWHVIILGPVVKIDPANLPANSNLHYLGMKPYEELPAYLAGWDVALLPFACNESTRFISPTKTLEYLAGGKPVVSTPIRDVMQPYGEQGLVSIAETASDFLAAIEEALSEQSRPDRRTIDSFLAQTSWNATWRKMSQLLHQAVALQVFRSRAAFSRPLLDVSAGSSLRKGRKHV